MTKMKFQNTTHLTTEKQTLGEAGRKLTEVKPNEKNTGPSADTYVRTSGNLSSVLILLQSESPKGTFLTFLTLTS